MLIVEVIGTFSTGKSTLIREILQNNKVISLHKMLPVWFLVKHFKEGLIQNLILEIFFLFRFHIKILNHLDVGFCFGIPGMTFRERVNFLRSLIRKLGYVFVIEKIRHKLNNKILLVDEGYYQLIQNLVVPHSFDKDYFLAFDLSYKPDLLILTDASDEVIFARSKSRKDLTQRYAKLSDKNLLRVIRLSRGSFEDFIKRYVDKFKCDLKIVNRRKCIDLKSTGVLVLNNE